MDKRIYGAIIGDMAGSIYEFEQTKKITPVNMNNIIEDNAFYSDDTILTIAILDASLHNQDYDSYLRKYILDYENYKVDFKPYFKSSFSPNLIKWAKENNIGNSIGNGALMRISPIAYMYDLKREVIEQAILATMPSHNSYEAINCATTLALMIYYLRNNYTKLDVLKKLKIDFKYRPFNKFNTTCEETLNNCLYAFYKSNDFESAIRNTLLMGGDTDTNCAIVASLASATYNIDNQLINKVNDKLDDKFVKILNKVR